MHDPQSGAEHICQSIELVVVVLGCRYSDRRNTLGQREDRQVVGAGDQHPAARDLTRHILRGAGTADHGTHLGGAGQQRQGVGSILIVVLGDDERGQGRAEFGGAGAHHRTEGVARGVADLRIVGDAQAEAEIAADLGTPHTVGEFDGIVTGDEYPVRRNTELRQQFRTAHPLAQADEVHLGQHLGRPPQQLRITHGAHALTDHHIRNAKALSVFQQIEGAVRLIQIDIGHIATALRDDQGGVADGGRNRWQRRHPRGLRPLLTADQCVRFTTHPIAHPAQMMLRNLRGGPPVQRRRTEEPGAGHLIELTAQTASAPMPSAAREDRFGLRQHRAHHPWFVGEHADAGLWPVLAQPVHGHDHHGDIAAIAQPILPVVNQYLQSPGTVFPGTVPRARRPHSEFPSGAPVNTGCSVRRGSAAAVAQPPK